MAFEIRIVSGQGVAHDLQDAVQQHEGGRPEQDPPQAAIRDAALHGQRPQQHGRAAEQRSDVYRKEYAVEGHVQQTAKEEGGGDQRDCAP